MTLWPISMLSRIFESESAAVPRATRADESELQQAAAGELERSLGEDHPVDVVEIALTEVRDDRRADRVHLVTECLELIGVGLTAVQAWPLLLVVDVLDVEDTSPTGLRRRS